MQLVGTPGLGAVVHPVGPPFITTSPVLQSVLAAHELVPPGPGGGPYWPPYGAPCVPPAARFSGLVAGHEGVSSIVPTAESASLAPSSPEEAMTVQPLRRA